MRRWFLSYHSPDQALAEQIKAAIERKEEGASVFFAPRDLRAGGRWAPALAQAISDASAFVLLVTDKGIGRWQEIEYDAAFDKHVTSPDFPVVLMLLEGQSAPRLSFLKQLHWIVTSDPASEKAVTQLLEAVSSSSEEKPREPWRYTSPYRGLSAMEERDSDYFFGRERETIEVLNVLAAAPNKVPMLLGNSGVGKSSLAQAGVIAALRRQAWPDRTTDAEPRPIAFINSRHWCFLTFKPGGEPIKALVEPFLRTWQYDATDPEWEERQKGWAERLLDGRATLRGLLNATERRYEQIGLPKPPAFFLYVDQGEELYVRGERQRRRFSELLSDAIADPRVMALMSMRSDFLGQLQNDEKLFAVHHKIDVPPLRETELTRVIREPAQQLSARFEPEELVSIITRRVLEDSAEDVGALPLLSYTLEDMWTGMVRRGDGALRLPPGAFELGGVLAERANAFLALNPTSEGALRRVLTIGLATVRKEGDPTRRRARRSEFSEDEWRLVTELADHPNRLLVTVTPEGGETYAEVAHEAIFRRWEKLRDWISVEREFLAWKSTLDEDHRAWEEAPEASKKEALLMGLKLVQAQGWYLERVEELSKADREFIVLSQKAENDRREASRQLEIQRIRAEEEVARLRAEREAQEQRERANAEEMAHLQARREAYQQQVARLRAEQEAREQRERAAAEELARLRAENEARTQRERADATVKLNRRRYYSMLATAAIGASILLVYLGYSAYEKQQQDAFARQNFQLAVASAQQLLDQVSESLNHGDIGVKGATDMFRVASGIVEQVRTIERTPETAELLVKLSWTASDIYATLGNLIQAYDSAKSARDLIEPFYVIDPNNPKVLALLFNSIWRMGDAIADRDLERATQEQALKEYLEAEKVARRLAAMAPKDTGRQRNIAFILWKIGDLWQGQSDWQSAAVVYSEALTLIRDIVAVAPQNRDSQRDLANALSRMSQALAGKGDLDGALMQYRTAFEIRTALATRDPNDDVLQSNLATSHREIARLYVQRGDLDAALTEYRLAIGIRERLLTKDPANVNQQISLVPLYAESGATLRRKGDLAAALEYYRKAYTLRQGLALKDPTNEARQYSFATAGISVADLLLAQNQDLNEAVTLYRAAIDALDDIRPRYDQDVFRCYIKIGDIQKSRDDLEGALTEYRRAAAIAEESAAKNATSVTWQKYLEESYVKIGEILIAHARPREALEHYQKALEFVEALAAKYPEAWAALVASLKAKIEVLQSKH